MSYVHIQYWKTNITETSKEIINAMRSLSVPVGDPYIIHAGFSGVYFGRYTIKIFNDCVRFDDQPRCETHKETYFEGYAIQFCGDHRIDMWVEDAKYSFDTRHNCDFFISSRLPFHKNPASLDMPVSVMVLDFKTNAKSLNSKGNMFPHIVHRKYKETGIWEEGIEIVD